MNNKILDLNTFRISERHLENFSGKGFHRLDIRFKLALLAIVIVLNIGLAIPLLSGILFFIGFVLLIASVPSTGRTLLFFLGPIFATSVAFIGYSIGFGQTAVFTFGKLNIYKEGLILGLGVILRVYCDISWLALTFITTPFPDVLKALRWYKIPTIIVDTLAMMYRYSFLLFEEFTRMYTSATSRGGRIGSMQTIKTLSLIGAQLFIRAYDRSEKIFTAMLSRGLESDKIDQPELIKYKKYNGESKNMIVETINDVTFSFSKGIHILNNLNLSIHKGDSIAICGPNGSGKTTLLKICAGLLLPKKGNVQLMGVEINKETKKTIFRDVGFLFQDSEDQLFCPTVKEDISFGPLNMDLSEDEVKDRVQYAMDIMKITHLCNRPIYDLSGGEKKRVALAGILAMKTPIMLLDEPTSGLDPSSAKELISLLRELNEKYNYTLLVATHEIDRIPDFAKRVIIINNGNIYKDGDVRDVITDIQTLKDVDLEAPIITQFFYQKRYPRVVKSSLPLNLDEAFKMNRDIHN